MNVDEIKEITLFCEQGDSAKISTWSNVPYFLAKTLEERGIKLNRVNLNPGSNRFHKAFYKLWNVFAKGVFRNKYYTYRRSGIYYFLIERRIRKALRQFPNADLCLFTTYNFSSSDFSAKPVLLFNDWTADYDARHFKGIDPAPCCGAPCPPSRFKLPINHCETQYINVYTKIEHINKGTELRSTNLTINIPVIIGMIRPLACFTIDFQKEIISISHFLW